MTLYSEVPINMVASPNRKSGKGKSHKKKSASQTQPRARMASSTASGEPPEALKARQKKCQDSSMLCIRDEAEAKTKYPAWTLRKEHRELEPDDVRRQRKAVARVKAQRALLKKQTKAQARRIQRATRRLKQASMAQGTSGD